MSARTPRGLSPEEQALWARLAASVTPLHPRKAPNPAPAKPVPVPLAKSAPIAPVPKPPKGRVPAPIVRKPAAPVGSRAPSGLDSHWERKLGRAAIAPEVTLDLHGHTLDQAHQRLDSGLMQAKAMGARLVLVITGKARPVDAADRGERRGAIRAKILDWLAAGAHSSDIAAIRNAHRRHGGDGAIYIVLKRR